MRQRGFTADDVTRIIEHAEVDMPGGEGSPLRRAVEGEAAVIYSPEERTVLTVMWRRPSLTPAAP
jgi:hypothetical protein